MHVSVIYHQTVYRQCREQQNETNVNQTEVECKLPWSHVPENVFPNLWRVVYWTSQCLTWFVHTFIDSLYETALLYPLINLINLLVIFFLVRLIMPVMQSYSRAGEFTWKGKIKSAVIDNTIYYGTYLFICGILLIYLALQPAVELDWYVQLEYDSACCLF